MADTESQGIEIPNVTRSRLQNQNDPSTKKAKIVSGSNSFGSNAEFSALDSFKPWYGQPVSKTSSSKTSVSSLFEKLRKTNIPGQDSQTVDFVNPDTGKKTATDILKSVADSSSYGRRSNSSASNLASNNPVERNETRDTTCSYLKPNISTIGYVDAETKNVLENVYKAETMGLKQHPNLSPIRDFIANPNPDDNDTYTVMMYSEDTKDIVRMANQLKRLYPAHYLYFASVPTYLMEGVYKLYFTNLDASTFQDLIPLFAEYNISFDLIEGSMPNDQGKVDAVASNNLVSSQEEMDANPDFPDPTWLVEIYRKATSYNNEPDSADTIGTILRTLHTNRDVVNDEKTYTMHLYPTHYEWDCHLQNCGVLKCGHSTTFLIMDVFVVLSDDQSDSLTVLLKSMVDDDNENIIPRNLRLPSTSNSLWNYLFDDSKRRRVLLALMEVDLNRYLKEDLYTSTTSNPIFGDQTTASIAISNGIYFKLQYDGDADPESPKFRFSLPDDDNVLVTVNMARFSPSFYAAKKSLPIAFGETFYDFSDYENALTSDSRDYHGSARLKTLLSYFKRPVTVDLSEKMKLLLSPIVYESLFGDYSIGACLLNMYIESVHMYVHAIRLLADCSEFRKFYTSQQSLELGSRMRHPRDRLEEELKSCVLTRIPPYSQYRNTRSSRLDVVRPEEYYFTAMNANGVEGRTRKTSFARNMYTLFKLVAFDYRPFSYDDKTRYSYTYCCHYDDRIVNAEPRKVSINSNVNAKPPDMAISGTSFLPDFQTIYYEGNPIQESEYQQEGSPEPNYPVILSPSNENSNNNQLAENFVDTTDFLNGYYENSDEDLSFNELLNQ